MSENIPMVVFDWDEENLTAGSYPNAVCSFTAPSGGAEGFYYRLSAVLYPTAVSSTTFNVAVYYSTTQAHEVNPPMPQLVTASLAAGRTSVAYSPAVVYVVAGQRIDFKTLASGTNTGAKFSVGIVVERLQIGDGWDV